VPPSTATAVRLLEDAGYANVGKTNLHEFAYGVTSENPHYGTVPNPIAPGRIAGGSSGGSAAALAGGFADAALGTDSGGSIRIPAACCGVVGFKPTYGLVPLDGCFPLASSFDHAGPMARTVEACEAALVALTPGYEPVELNSLDDLTVAVAWLEHSEPLLRARVEESTRLFGHRRPVEIPYPQAADPLFMREVADVHRDLYAEHRDLYGEDVAARIEQCLDVSDAEASASARFRGEYRESTLELLAGAQLLLTPTLPRVAPPTGEGQRDELVRFTYPINVLGWPALALPCGPAEDGLPASIQIVGRSGDDAVVLAAGRLLESLLRGTPERG
jgi:aspartyl-tRNA(Asn)/glutamyl-tRNA(Gln) amidotransferase subunit A